MQGLNLFATAIGAIIAAAAPPAMALAAGTTDRKPEATAIFVDGKGAKTGEAQLFETPSGVLIHVEVKGLPAGKWVAFHAHEHAACSPGDGHKAAGGHFNPTSAKHGYFAEGGPHAGDMPNQRVDSDGVLRAEVFAPMLSLGGAGRASSNVSGRTLMIHARPDDYASQPAGDAGDRIACAPIVRAGAEGKGGH
ncbi:superoxide dismutase [Cu-Zn] [Camelimonas fluminis]|uniref:Superoxide dismutase [Cu-Zn] n=1 Tax=Camelimonas fluminis TaxID=1576911 RepID=A0ABV7UF78_9HYPH|nr:superoxide dismutase family protein [Camelimonas fluminis]GHE70390.1 superoxide dismutase [Cu-Zn] [Camelimonas fluminis]